MFRNHGHFNWSPDRVNAIHVIFVADVLLNTVDVQRLRFEKYPHHVLRFWDVMEFWRFRR